MGQVRQPRTSPAAAAGLGACCAFAAWGAFSSQGAALVGLAGGVALAMAPVVALTAILWLSVRWMGGARPGCSRWRSRIARRRACARERDRLRPLMESTEPVMQELVRTMLRNKSARYQTGAAQQPWDHPEMWRPAVVIVAANGRDHRVLIPDDREAGPPYPQEEDAAEAAFLLLTAASARARSAGSRHSLTVSAASPGERLVIDADGECA